MAARTQEAGAAASEALTFLFNFSALKNILFLGEGSPKALQTQTEYGKLSVKSEHAVCPRCRKRMSPRILPTTEGKDMVLYCRACKTEIIVDIEKGQRLKGRGQ